MAKQIVMGADGRIWASNCSRSIYSCGEAGGPIAWSQRLYADRAPGGCFS
jgi:hypothetical protein